MYIAIIVTYYPELDQLVKMTNELLKANVRVVIYDNTPHDNGGKGLSHDNEGLSDDNESVYIISNGINDGLGAAFNNSITYLKTKEKKIKGVLFFDQDSVIKCHDIVLLISELEALIKMRIPVGVLGASPVDKNGYSYKVRRERALEKENIPDKFSKVSFVITSFSIVPFSVFTEVGMFDERLFIDLVDSEFSYRCKKNGFLNLLSNKVIFEHSIGEERGTFLGRKFAISSPIRNYYQARNLIIVGRDYCWYRYALVSVCKRFVQVFLSGVIMGDLNKRMKYFFNGVWDGLNYRTGPYGGAS